MYQEKKNFTRINVIIMQEQFQKLVELFVQTRDENIFADIVQQVTPYISSICRKYVEDKSDTDDAVQETLIKFVNNLTDIHSNHLAWLARTARNTAISINRHQQSQRLRRENRATTVEHDIPWDALYFRLDKALLQIHDEYREYIVQHHINNTPLFEIAREKQISKSTASRRLAAAHQSLRNAFKDMDLETFEDLCNDHLFVTAITNYVPQHSKQHQTFNVDSVTATKDDIKPIRIGIFLSHQSYLARTRLGAQLPMPFQIYNMKNFEHPNVRIVGLIEPGTIDYGPIESTLRDHSFNAGYMNAANPESLKSLDVITLGYNFIITPPVIRAITEAVESGVGLLNEGNIGGSLPGLWDQRLQNLMLSNAYIGYYHTHPYICHIPVKSIVRHSHNIIDSLAPGTELDIPGCGPIFIPKPEAKVLIENIQPVYPTVNKQHTACPSPIRKPILLTGQVGRGRVIVNTSFDFRSIGDHQKYRGDFILKMINYLAEPRILQKQLLCQ
ncbi:sigma-70 family RNA polymerase sigma factor [Planctomycetota bacterium]|nr:sigma-70 family RNA polymerase sigma factor [Planctomycetota bacterium]